MAARFVSTCTTSARTYAADGITVSEIQRDICEKMAILSFLLAFDAPVWEVPVSISACRLGRKNCNGIAIW